ncbi:MAG: class I SAM-dependent methyltransferase [Candidatus Micrarchaeota archaeon]|nr:class I SAM-dependent methyltransferase [Candidatus Micrarchaeota archaeon]
MPLPDYDAQHLSYDLIYRGYSEDLPFYLSEAKKAKGPVLEAGCGTGRILLALLEANVDAYGIDVSPKMIARLKKKASEKGLDVKGRAKVADMRNLKAKSKYSLIIAPFRVFLHLISQKDQLSALRSMRRALRKGGKAILNFFLPSASFIAKNYGKKMIWRPALQGKAPANLKLRVEDAIAYESEPDQIIRIRQSVFSGKRKLAEYSFRLALVYKREFELLLRLAGFSKWKVYGGFKKGKLASSKQEMVWEVFK